MILKTFDSQATKVDLSNGELSTRCKEGAKSAKQIQVVFHLTNKMNFVANFLVKCKN